MRKLATATVFLFLILGLCSCAGTGATSSAQGALTAFNLRKRLDSITIEMSRQEVEERIGKPDLVSRIQMVSASGYPIQVNTCTYTEDGLSYLKPSVAFYLPVFMGPTSSPSSLVIQVVYFGDRVHSVQRFYQ